VPIAFRVISAVEKNEDGSRD